MYSRLKVFMQAQVPKCSFIITLFLDITCNKSMSRQLHAGVVSFHKLSCAGKQGKFGKFMMKSLKRQVCLKTVSRWLIFHVGIRKA